MECIWKIVVKKVWQSHAGEDFFLCKCSNIKVLKLNRIPKFYLNALQSFSEFCTKFTPNSLQDILDTPLFGNENIKFRGKSLFFKSFLYARLETGHIMWLGMAGVHTGFHTIALVLYIGSLPNLATWFPCGRGRTQFILGSLGQRSRSLLL